MSKIDEERILKPASGFAALFGVIFGAIIGFGFIIASSVLFDAGVIGGVLFGLALAFGIILFIVSLICINSLKIVKPNEALVLSLFGKYHGTIYDNGFFAVNPFCNPMRPEKSADSAGITTERVQGARASVKAEAPAVAVPKTKISTKVATFMNAAQKVNDAMGNPVEVSAIVVWRVVNATKAVINVDNYTEFLSNQADSAIRNVARLYPYDDIDDDPSNNDSELTLRGSSTEVAKQMKEELSERVTDAGIEIIEVRLNQIAYATEVAAAMLQRQQAVAIIAARQKIVEGAVSMVEMALDKLKADGVVDLDEEKKAQMVSNLLVVLCGSKEANPVVNTGSIY